MFMHFPPSQLLLENSPKNPGSAGKNLLKWSFRCWGFKKFSFKDTRKEVGGFFFQGHNMDST